MKPQRIQLRRTEGWNLQKFSMELNGLPAVNCARRSGFGNPFRVGRYLTAEQACNLYEAKMDKGFMRIKIRDELRGKNLACWCPLSAEHCHCNWLLEVANSDKPLDRASRLT